MATFGTPIEGENDANNCYECAKAMAAAVKDWNTRRAREGKQEIQIGIGIHYGPCVMGDIGGETRMEFAVIGDTVNIASRVEAKTRELGIEIAATQSLVDRIEAESVPVSGGTFQRFDDQSIRGSPSRLPFMAETFFINATQSLRRFPSVCMFEQRICALKFAGSKCLASGGSDF